MCGGRQTECREPAGPTLPHMYTGGRKRRGGRGGGAGGEARGMDGDDGRGVKDRHYNISDVCQCSKTNRWARKYVQNIGYRIIFVLPGLFVQLTKFITFVEIS